MRACLHLCQHPLSAPLHPKTVLYSADSFMGNQRQAGCPGRAGPGVAQSGGVPHQGATCTGPGGASQARWPPRLLAHESSPAHGLGFQFGRPFGRGKRQLVVQAQALLGMLCFGQQAGRDSCSKPPQPRRQSASCLGFEYEQCGPQEGRCHDLWACSAVQE
jgi:hypothetical protein